jgi:hypothetical protein
VEPLLFFIGFAVLVAVLIVFGWYFAAKRRKELEDWARARGYRFQPGNDYSFDERYAEFSCLKEGSERYAYNVIDGDDAGRRFRAFDYHYETYSTDSKGHRTTNHHYFSAAVVTTDLPLRPLSIREEGFFDKVGAFLGFDDINFESAEFSAAFCVKASDRRWAYDVITQETMEFLLASPRFTLDFQGHHVLAYRGSTFAVQDFDAALEVIDGVLKRLPASVVRELKGERP